MTQEYKQLLLKDVCARLSFGVKGMVYAEVTNGEYDIRGDMIFFDAKFNVELDSINTSTEEIHVVAIGNEDTVNFIEEQQEDKPYVINEFKPYLRPMSSMTKEEKVYLSQRHFYEGESAYANVYIAAEVVDWMTKHHLDFRGLIPKGLALEAPDGMYKVKKK